MQLERRKGNLNEIVLQIYHKYSRVPVLSGADKRIKKFLKLEPPPSFEEGHPGPRNTAKRSLRDRIKELIEMNRDKRDSFFSIVKQAANRARNSFRSWGQKGLEGLKLIENDIDRKISDVKNKIFYGKIENQIEMEKSQNRLTVLKGMKEKQVKRQRFLIHLETVIAGKDGSLLRRLVLILRGPCCLAYRARENTVIP